MSPGWRRRARAALFAWLAVCALFTALQGALDPEPPPHRRATVLAVGLAFGAIAARLFAGSPVAARSAREAAAALHLLALAGLGATGAWLGAETGAVRSGLALCAGALVLGLRPLPPLPAAGEQARGDP